MTSKTRDKLALLNEYLLQRYQDWIKINPANITGFRIGRKNGKGNYAIIFQVKRKKELQSLNIKFMIPPHIPVRTPDGTLQLIKTDVEETGKGKLQFSTCKKNLAEGKTTSGTIAAFVESGGQRYAITNYHVAGWDLMKQGQFDFSGTHPGIDVDQYATNMAAGTFNDGLDVGFVRVSDSAMFNNHFADGSRVEAHITDPLPVSAKDLAIRVYSRRRPAGIHGKINNVSAIFNTGFNNFYMKNLIQIRPAITVKGDSGSPVMAGGTLIGIIVGADNSYSYAIPYNRIYSFFPTILTS